jgi:copper chaperone
VHIEPTDADEQELRNAIAEAGYTPALVQAAAANAESRKTGRCCGCCG